VPPELREMSAAGFPKRLKFIDMCYRAGVRVIAGTDGARLGTMLPGFGLQHELALPANAGLPPLAVLRAATITAAEALGHEKDLGSLEAGKFADIVILTADPLVDVANAHKIDTVIKGGQSIGLRSCSAPSRRRTERRVFQINVRAHRESARRVRTTTLTRCRRCCSAPQLVVLFYRPPGLADDDGTGALDACRVPQHGEVEFA